MRQQTVNSSVSSLSNYSQAYILGLIKKDTVRQQQRLARKEAKTNAEKPTDEDKHAKSKTKSKGKRPAKDDYESDVEVYDDDELLMAAKLDEIEKLDEGDYVDGEEEAEEEANTDRGRDVKEVEMEMEAEVKPRKGKRVREVNSDGDDAQSSADTQPVAKRTRRQIKE